MHTRSTLLYTLPALTTVSNGRCDSLVSPQPLHHVFYFLRPFGRRELHLLAFGSKFGHVHLGKLLQGESPAMQAGAKAHRPDDRINL